MASLLLNSARLKCADLVTVSHLGDCCRKTYTSASGQTGSFTSPGYPDFYPSLTRCQYHFRGTSDERIKISFTDFDLQVGESSTFSDYQGYNTVAIIPTIPHIDGYLPLLTGVIVSSNVYTKLQAKNTPK